MLGYLFPQIVRTDIILGLHLIQFLLLLVDIQSFEGLGRLVVQHHQVPVTHVKPGQMVTGVLGVEDVLINDEGSSAGFRRIAPEID